MANVHVGVLSLGINGGYLCNFAPNFGIRKPKCISVVSDINLRNAGAIKSCVFDAAKPEFGVARASGSGEAEAHSSSLQLVEEELKFRPTFQDYLKVMESVRTHGSKGGDEVANVVVTPKKKKLGGRSSYRDRERGSSTREKVSRGEIVSGKQSGGRRRGSGWGLVNQILEKKTLKDDETNLKASKSSLNEKLNGTSGILCNDRVRKGGASPNKLKDHFIREVDGLTNHGWSNDTLESTKSHKLDEAGNLGDDSERVYVKDRTHASNRKELREEKFHGDRFDRRTADFENNENLTNRKVWSRKSTERNLDESLVTKRQNDTFSRSNHEKNISQEQVGFKGDAEKTEIPGSKAIETKGTYAKRKTTQLEKIEREEIDIEDRAAFRTFEVFTDVNNRPRVLRMELEERIQKLAKLLNATDVNMPEWQFSKMIHGAKIKFTEHSILRIVQILGTLGNWKRALQVVQWLQSRERFKSYKSRYIYTSVLDVLGKAKRPIEALNVFYAMRQDLSSYPDLAAYHCIAVTLGQAGLMKELFDVIDCMRAPPEKKFKLGPLKKWDPRVEPDLVIYNAVLNVCVQKKQWEGAFWVLQQLKEQNIQPTNTTYGLIMEVMLASAKYNLVHEFFRKVEKTSIPSALNYKVLVNTLWREGKTDEAILAVKDMERRGVVGSAGLYYDLARCLCSAGRCQEALMQVDKICKVAKRPLVVTYTGLIQACLDSGNIQDATYIFSEMHKFCTPNTVTMNIMLKSYVQHGMFKEAKDLFRKVLDSSHQITSKYDTKQKAVPDKFTFNTMMDACAATNNWDDFVYAYEQMLRHGYHFDTRRHLRLVLEAFRAEKEQVIEITWTHLVRFNRSPPPPIIHEQFCIKLQAGDPTAAISCIRAHQESVTHAFSERTWLNLLQRNSHRFNNHTINRLMSELSSLIRERDCQSPVFQNILNACRKLAVNGNDSSM